MEWKHFLLAGPLWGESAGSQKPVTQCFNVICDVHLKKTVEQTLELSVISGAIMNMWRYCNATAVLYTIYIALKLGPVALHQHDSLISILTHPGRTTHICVSKLTIIGSDNGLSPDRRQAIIGTNAGILLIGPVGTNFSETLKELHTSSLKKMHLKMSSVN